MKLILLILVLNLMSVSIAHSSSGILNNFTDEKSFHDCIIYVRDFVEKAAAESPPGTTYHKAKFFIQPPYKVENQAFHEYRVDLGAIGPVPRGQDWMNSRVHAEVCTLLVPKAGVPPDFVSTLQKVTDQRKECSKFANGSVIDFGKKTVIESIPVAGTSLSLNYSSAFNNNTLVNRKIPIEYKFFKNISSRYHLRAISSTNDELLSETIYRPIVPFNFYSDFVPRDNQWVHSAFKSTARTKFQLYSYDPFPALCYTEFYVEQNIIQYVDKCELAIDFVQLHESIERNVVLYRPEVWGMHGWTLSAHHYYDSEFDTLYSGDGEKIEYSSTKNMYDSQLGFIYAVVSKSNDQEIFIFDLNGRHLETRNAILGDVIYKFSYDANNRLISVADRFNSKTTFVHSGSNLQKIVSPFGVETLFQIQENRLVKAIDPEGFSYEMSYDELGLLNTYKSVNEVVTTFTYNQIGEFQREDKNNGVVQYFTMLVNNGVKEFVKYAGFGIDRKVVDEVTPEGTNIVELDENNNEISRTSRSFSFNIFSHKTSGESLEQSFVPSFEWGDNKINVNQQVRNISESGQSITEISDFNELRTYNAVDNVLNLQTFEQTISTGGAVTQSIYSKESGTYLFNDAYGVRSTISLNSSGLVSQISRIDSYPTNFQYDSNGRLTKVVKGTQFEVYGYDSNGYLASTNNNKGQLTRYIRNKKGQLLTKVLPNNDSISFEYTGGGEVKKIIAPNGQVHNFEMSLGDYITQAITPSNKATLYEYDADKRLKSVVRPSGKSLNYEYEPGKADLKRISTSNGVVNINERDVRSRIRSITSADNIKTDISWVSDQVQSQTWFDNGQLIAKLSNNFYADQFRIKEIHLNDNLLASYGYQNGILRTIDNLGVTYTHEFGEYYHLQNVTNSSGLSVGYITQDTLNGEQPEQVINAQVYDGPEAQLYITLKRAYDNFGQATEFTTTTLNQATGVYNSYFSLMPVYDANNRLVQMNKTRKSFVNGEEVNSQDFVNQYLYPPNSNNNVKTYLQSISINRTQTPIKRTTASHNQDDQLTKLQGSINRDYKYDNDGNLSEMTNCFGTTSYEYDAFGNLKKVTLPGNKIIEYKVDAFNRRFKKLINGQVTEYYLWYDQIRLAAILDGSKNVKAAYVYGSESSHVPSFVIKDNKAYKIIHDPGTSSVRYIVDAENAMIVQESEYDEHGNIMKNTNAEFQPLGFAGGLYDADTKLIRFGARDYDPTIGRWTTKDPIGFAGGDTNLYAYVGGNPMSYNDPTGLAAVCSRPLEGLDRMVNGQPLDLLNLEVSHQNIFYDDGGNIGFFKDGVRSDKHNKSEYTCKDKHYDDNIMKKAVEKAKSSGRFNGKSYGFISNNCQDFLSNVLYHYQQMGGK